jgi:hypothetical protein
MSHPLEPSLLEWGEDRGLDGILAPELLSLVASDAVDVAPRNQGDPPSAQSRLPMYASPPR